MNVRNLLTKVFLGSYFVLLLPHIFTLPPSVLSILILVSGVLFAIVAHTCKYTLLAKLFLMVHMVLELPHMIDHIHHDTLPIVFGHSVHVIFDLVLLYMLSQSWKYFLLFISIVLMVGASIHTLLPVIESTRPFVLGGVLGCIGTHFLFHNFHKPAT